MIKSIVREIVLKNVWYDKNVFTRILNIVQRLITFLNNSDLIGYKISNWCYVSA